LAGRGGLSDMRHGNGWEKAEAPRKALLPAECHIAADDDPDWSAWEPYHPIVSMFANRRHRVGWTPRKVVYLEPCLGADADAHIRSILSST
jgi:hypothetical protein